MDENWTGLPPGWEYSKTKGCVVRKHLEDFKYVEVHYESDPQWGHDYALYMVNRDGPRQEERQGIFNDLGKAIRAGDKL